MHMYAAHPQVLVHVRRYSRSSKLALCASCHKYVHTPHYYTRTHRAPQQCTTRVAPFLGRGHGHAVHRHQDTRTIATAVQRDTVKSAARNCSHNERASLDRSRSQRPHAWAGLGRPASRKRTPGPATSHDASPRRTNPRHPTTTTLAMPQAGRPHAKRNTPKRLNGTARPGVAAVPRKTAQRHCAKTGTGGAALTATPR